MKRRGFTLIELLVVIAIIAVLAAILFPVFSRAREKARQASCLSNVKQLSLAFEMYSQDYDECYPGSPNGNGGNGVYGGWVWYDTFPVPTAGKFEVTRGALYPYVKNRQVYICPDDRSGGGCSYEMNGWLRFASIAAVQSTADTALLVEENDHGTANDGYFDLQAGDQARYSHNDGTVLGFADGHAKWEKWELQRIYAACQYW